MQHSDAPIYKVNISTIPQKYRQGRKDIDYPTKIWTSPQRNRKESKNIDHPTKIKTPFIKIYTTPQSLIN